MFRKEKTNKSKQLTPKKRDGTRQSKDKLSDYLLRVESELDQFLVDNFSSVLENTFDCLKYFGRVIKMFGELKTSTSEIVSSIFKKVKTIVQPLTPAPVQRERKKSVTNIRSDNSLLCKFQSELRCQNDLISRLSDQNLRLKSNLRSQLQSSKEDRMKQNRMTELLYILRKRHIDIDRIYEQSCETPGLSKKESFESSSQDLGEDSDI